MEPNAIDESDGLVLRAQWNRSAVYPLVLGCIGGVVALGGGVGIPSDGGFDLRFACIAVAIFGGWAVIWWVYCISLPCRVTYSCNEFALQAFRGRRLVRTIPRSEVENIEWGLPTYDWSGMMLAPFGANMPRLLVTVKGKTRFDSASVWFPPICIWGEEVPHAYQLALRNKFGLGKEL